MEEAGEELPKDPNAAGPEFPEDSYGVEYQMQMEPQFEIDTAKFGGEVELLAAEFTWSASDPHPDGYVLTHVAVEPASAPRDQVRDLLQRFIDVQREEGYEMADLPDELPMN